MNNQLGASEETGLVERILQRDEAALREIIQSLGPQVKALCLGICADDLEAEEVVSIVFWELWNRTDRFDGTRGSLRTYLLTLARSRAIDTRRAALARRRNLGRYFDSGVAPMDTDKTEDSFLRHAAKEESARLRQALEHLPAQQKSALQLAFFEGLSHREVAEEQDLPLGTVKTNIRRGLLRLKQFMADPTAAGRLA